MATAKKVTKMAVKAPKAKVPIKSTQPPKQMPIAKRFSKS